MSFGYLINDDTMIPYSRSDPPPFSHYTPPAPFPCPFIDDLGNEDLFPTLPSADRCSTPAVLDQSQAYSLDSSGSSSRRSSNGSTSYASSIKSPCLNFSLGSSINFENLRQRRAKEGKGIKEQLERAVQSVDALPKTAETRPNEHLYSRLWHQRLCHIGSAAIEAMSKRPEFWYLVAPRGHCEHCIKLSQTREMYASLVDPESGRRLLSLVSTRPLELVHVTLAGSYAKSFSKANGKKYQLVLVDDYSRYVSTYFLTSNQDSSAVSRALQKFIDHVSNKKRAISLIRTDRSVELFHNEITATLRFNGIKHERHFPAATDQPTVASSAVAILELATAILLATSGLSESYWTKAMAYANHTLNRVLSPDLGLAVALEPSGPHCLIPFERFYGIGPPDLTYTRVFGSVAEVHRTGSGHTTSKPQLSLMLGYTCQENNLNIYWYQLWSKGEVSPVGRGIKWNELKFPAQPQEHNGKPLLAINAKSKFSLSKLKKSTDLMQRLELSSSTFKAIYTEAFAEKKCEPVDDGETDLEPLTYDMADFPALDAT